RGGVAAPSPAAAPPPRAFEPLNRAPLLHSSTFGGNPLAMAAAVAAVSVIRDDDLVVRARKLGTYLLQRLRFAIESTVPKLILDIRGVGLLIGLEFHADHLAADFIIELMQRRVLVSASLNAHRVVRFTPPAVMTDEQVDWLIGAVSEAVYALGKRYTPVEAGMTA